MSRHWGYACLSHNPMIESDHWFNRGDKVLEDLYRKVRSGEWPSVPEEHHPSYMGYIEPMHIDPYAGGDEAVPVLPQTGDATPGPVYWLNQHPNCLVVLRSEYGEARRLSPEPADVWLPGNRIDLAPTPPYLGSSDHPIESIRSTMAFSSLDWSARSNDAWLWGIVFGWDGDPDDPESGSAWESIATRHGWDDKMIATLKTLHERFKATLPPLQ